MGKRYYCDYCNRSFIDEISSRKKHLSSINHKQAMKQHYLRFRDLRDLVQEESVKGTCLRYPLGKCPYNENCLYSHYSQVELKQFTKQIEDYEKERLQHLLNLPCIDDWLNKRKIKSSNLAISSEGTSSIHDQSIQTLPYDLPPSLLLVNGYDLKNIEFTEWG